MILGKSLAQWREKFSDIDRLMAAEPVLWINPQYASFDQARSAQTLGMADIADAEARLLRFAPYIAKVFSETRADKGIIESPLRAVPNLQQALQKTLHWQVPGRLLLKCDNQLAVSGSIKARGGIYEVLKHAESLALAQRLISPQQDYAQFDSEALRQLFSRHSISVGSTGNLGLSIGIVSAQLGFRVQVHMSADARQWKKDLLREKGVNVIEYQSDYGEAVKQGRAQAMDDPDIHFVDDESSLDLFLGYAVAANRLKVQLDALGIEVSEEKPLLVYLPCGVGGGPGGICFGLKQLFGDAVHCFFAEPVASPGMLLGLMSGLHDRVDVRDFGLDNVTAADGLAVARPSGLVAGLMQQLLSGVYTLQDEMLFRLLVLIRDSENIKLEPSALAGLSGPAMLTQSDVGRAYLAAQGLTHIMSDATHIVWATGGGMVPEAEMNQYYQQGLFACGAGVSLQSYW